jgi:hypothetical protein
MRRVGRVGAGWLGVEGVPDEGALETAIRVNLEPGTSVELVADKLERLADSRTDEALVDAFALFPSLDQMLDFANQVITTWSDRRTA